MKELSYDELRNAVSSHAAAFRCVTDYQPAGGPGDKVFPPTYEGGQYAVEDRMIDGELVPCVLLDSVQSQANRMEMALLDACLDGRIRLPVVEAAFEDKRLLKTFTVTSLEAPHRIADAIFRDSMISENGEQVMFRKSKKGKILDSTDIHHATGLFGLCPTALVFGIWDSTGPRGGMGAKIQRALVSELIGFHAQQGVRTSSRIDPLQVKLGAGPIYKQESKDKSDPDWTLVEDASPKQGKKTKGLKENKPSEINHGNVTPSIVNGGFTISRAVQTTVISLPAIRRLRFPLNGDTAGNRNADITARTVLAALGLLAATLVREEGADLRSRCHLVPTEDFAWELLKQSSGVTEQYRISADGAISLFSEAVRNAIEMKLPWEDKVQLVPHANLIELVLRSQKLEALGEAEEGE